MSKKGEMEPGVYGLIHNSHKYGQSLNETYTKVLMTPSPFTKLLLNRCKNVPTDRRLPIEYRRGQVKADASSSRSSRMKSNPRDLDQLFLYDDATFQTVMRLSRRQIEAIHTELQRFDTDKPVKVVGLLSLLSYLTDAQSSFGEIADMIEAGIDVAEDLLDETSTAVVNNLQEFSGLLWPDFDMHVVVKGFEEKTGVQRVGGILGHEFLTVSHGPTILLQTVVDHMGLIRHFKVDCAVDPVGLLESSNLYDVLDGDEKPWDILCDASYPRLVNLQPPYCGEMRFKQREYNQLHLQTRQVLVNAFKNLVDCFPKLKSLEKPSLAIVGAALVFYNIIYGAKSLI